MSKLVLPRDRHLLIRSENFDIERLPTTTVHAASDTKCRIRFATVDQREQAIRTLKFIPYCIYFCEPGEKCCGTIFAMRKCGASLAQAGYSLVIAAFFVILDGIAQLVDGL